MNLLRDVDKDMKIIAILKISLLKDLMPGIRKNQIEKFDENYKLTMKITFRSTKESNKNCKSGKFLTGSVQQS